jgi:mono/diheme cytochrome c family protein
MTLGRKLLTSILATLLSLVLVGCQNHQSRPIEGALELDAGTVSVAELELGRENYTLYCFACHGGNGTGDGPSAPGLRPPPRDFTTATYKFSWTMDGLPSDERLKEIVTGGLHGTAMLKWEMTDVALESIIQYHKTFAREDWEEEEALGELIVPTHDPWADKPAAGVARGKDVYHGIATCQACHPAYASEAEVNASLSIWGKAPSSRANPFYSEPKVSESFTVGDQPMSIMPPDFTFNPVRVSSELDDIYRTLGAGIPGTAMPAWQGSLPEEELWALTHYVKSLIDMRDTADAVVLRSRLMGPQASSL